MSNGRKHLNEEINRLKVLSGIMEEPSHDDQSNDQDDDDLENCPKCDHMLSKHPADYAAKDCSNCGWDNYSS